MMETTNLQQMAGKIFQAMNTRDFSDFEKIITDDVAFDFPGAGRVEGSRRTLLLLKSLHRKYPRLHFEVSEIITEQDRACVVWTNKGEDIHGNPYANAGLTLLHFRG
jgi:ketosteroid isomerase-like protein